MKDILLTFTKEQYDKYLELKSSDNIALDIVDLPPLPLPIKAENNFYSSIIAKCEEIIEFSKSDSIFGNKLTREQIKAIMPLYFELINNIRKAHGEISIHINNMSNYLIKLNKYDETISQKLSDFLPYKAALENDTQYVEKIRSINHELTSAISTVIREKERVVKSLAYIVKLTEDIIPSFIKQSSHTADSPSFKNFNQTKFFFEISSFAEQIKTITKQKEM